MNPLETNRLYRLIRARLARDGVGSGGGGGGPVAWADITGRPSTFPPSTHGHAIGDVTGLQTALDGKAATSHTHAISAVTGLQTALDGKANTTHGHAIGDVTGLQTALDGKQAAGSYAAATHTHAVADVAGLQGLLDAAKTTAPLVMRPAAGLFIGNGWNATALGTQAQVANRTIIAPWISARAVTIDQMGVSVSTFVAGQIKGVIFASDADGRPSTVLRESADIDSGTANGTRFASITPLALTAGTLYWIGLRSSATATVRTLGLGSVPALSYTNAATPVIQPALVRTETYATAAATWSYASSQHSNALVPLILMRVA